jgi:hypothetical protein
MPVNITQRNATRNQSTADFSVKRIAIFDNRFLPGVFKNNSGASFTLQAGMLVVRDVAVANGFLPATSANLADVLGVAVQEGDVVLADAGTTAINIVVSGTIDGTQLILPATITLNTTVGNKALKDVLDSLGLHIDESTVENTKFDN